MTTDRITDALNALRTFRNATTNLRAAWDRLEGPGDFLTETCPSDFPNIDEYEAEIAAWVRRAENLIG
jgi:hypothetical protein